MKTALMLVLAFLAAALCAPVRAQFQDATTVGQVTAMPSYCASIDGQGYGNTQWFRDAADVTAKTGKTVASQNGGICCTGSTVYNGSSCVVPSVAVYTNNASAVSAVAGANVMISWSASPGVGSMQVTCPGIGSWSWGASASGSMTVTTTESMVGLGIVTCSGVAQGSIPTSQNATVTVVCPTGSTYNSTTSKCVTPTAAVSVNGTTAATTTSGSAIAIGWSSTPAVTSMQVSCPGIGTWNWGTASAGSTSVTATDAMVGLGTVTCSGTAQGSIAATKATITVSCPSGKSYVGSSCVTPSAAVYVNSAAAATVTSGASVNLSWASSPAVTSMAVTCAGIGTWNWGAASSGATSFAATDAMVGMSPISCSGVAQSTIAATSAAITVLCPSTKRYDTSTHLCAAAQTPQAAPTITVGTVTVAGGYHGVAVTQNMILANTGAAITNIQPTIGGYAITTTPLYQAGGAGSYTIGGTCGSSLAAGASCTMILYTACPVSPGTPLPQKTLIITNSAQSASRTVTAGCL